MIPKEIRAAISVASVGLICLPGGRAMARPAYAAKENKPCSYCHINPAGGGARNANGTYYQAHGLSFAGFDEKKIATEPVFKSAWTVELPADTKRIAIADTTPDKQPRIIALGAGTSADVYKLAGSTLSKEATVDLGTDAGQFVAGHFAKGKPAEIVAPGAVFYLDGDKYTKKDLPDLKAVTGTVNFIDGSEEFYSFDGASAPQAYQLDGSLGLSPGRAMPMPGQEGGVVRSHSLRMSPDQLEQLQIPSASAKAGIVGGFDPRTSGKFYYWAPRILPDGSTFNIAASGASGPTETVVWKSDKLAGRPIDAGVASDPKGTGQTGIYILEATGADEKGRTLEFFALN